MNNYTVYLMITNTDGETLDPVTDVMATKFDLVDGYFKFYDMIGNVVSMFDENYVVGIIKEDENE